MKENRRIQFKNQHRPVIGIVGGGQLARMQAMAAARLGCIIHTIEKTDDCPAASVVQKHIHIAALQAPRRMGLGRYCRASQSFQQSFPHRAALAAFCCMPGVVQVECAL